MSLRLMDDQGGCTTTRAYPLIMGKVSLVMGKDGATRIINGNSWKRSYFYTLATAFTIFTGYT